VRFERSTPPLYFGLAGGKIMIPNVIFNYRKKTPTGLKNQHIISIVKMKNGIRVYLNRSYEEVNLEFDLTMRLTWLKKPIIT
jgi:hypothetical protein